MLIGKWSLPNSFLKSKLGLLNLGQGLNFDLLPCSFLFVLCGVLVSVLFITLDDRISAWTSCVGTGQNETLILLLSWDITGWYSHGQSLASTMSAPNSGWQIQILYVLMLTRTMGTHFHLLGVTMVLLTTFPIRRLLHALASTIHESHWVILLVLPFSTFMELARIQMASWVLPTHTWPNTDSELGFFFGLQS